jgi:formamidopyrimidine-DNA glycosylase
MPELPEVEAAVRVLRRAVSGRALVRLRLTHPALRRRVTRSQLASVRDHRISRVERRGKHQLIVLEDGPTIVAHFRMTGDWDVGTVAEAEPVYTRASFELDDGTRVALVDPRALSTVTVHRDVEDALPALGPEATDVTVDARALGAALARRRGPIKPALLDQRVLAGLGNIYAAEALWRARIDPRTAATTLTPDRLTTLLAGIRAVLARAGRRPARYRDSGDDFPGRFQVYDREGSPCRRCGTSIERITQAGRSTYFCPGCQT